MHIPFPSCRIGEKKTTLFQIDSTARCGAGVKLHQIPETDSLYAEFKAGPGVETRQVSDGLNVDLHADGRVVGFDVDLSTLETEVLRLRSIMAG